MPDPSIEPTFPRPWNPGNERPNTPMFGPLLPPPLFTEQVKYGDAVIAYFGDLTNWFNEGVFRLIEKKTGGKVSVPQLREMEAEAKPKAILKGILGRVGSIIFEDAISQPTSPHADRTHDPLPVAPIRTITDAARAVTSGALIAGARVGGFIAEVDAIVWAAQRARVVSGGSPNPGEDPATPWVPPASRGGMPDVQQNNPSGIVSNLTRESVTKQLRDGVTLVAQTGDP